MLSSMKIELILLIVVTTFRLVSCECRQSYVTICDNFNDITSDDMTMDWSDLAIGTDQSVANESVNLMHVLIFTKFPKLATLHIVQKIKNLLSEYAYQCSYNLVDLNLLSFFGNDFKKIELYQFPVVRTKKFSLVNNKIETIARSAFQYHEIVEFDMSDNFIEEIVQEALPLGKQTKVITIKNNKLTHIEPGSFPSSLKILNLDRNKLRHLSSGVLGNLTALRELILSNNKFRTIPDLHDLKELVIFNISSNFITSVDSEMFESLTKLELLDLSTNKIKEPDTLSLLLGPRHHPELMILLTFNHLRGLNLDKVVLKSEKLFLYGNPWDCDFWGNHSATILKHQDKCDSDLFSKGNAPYCINYKSELFPFDGLWDQHIERFHNSIPISVKTSCDLRRIKFQLSYPVSNGCVA